MNDVQRNFRNILFLFLAVILVLWFCFYTAGALFILFVWGPSYVDFNNIKPNLHDFPNNLWPTVLEYLLYWIKGTHYFDLMLRVKLIGSMLIPVSIVLTVLWFERETLLSWKPFKKAEALHGDAQWADETTIRKAGLRSRKGLLLGKDKKGLLIADGFQHALLFAPTGSGKGVGFVIPNLLFWEESVLVHDIKLENYELTSGWRKKQGQDVFVWNPAQPDGISHCYNPIDWISSKPGQMVDDVQKIANLIMPEQDFWVNEARSLFTGVVLQLTTDTTKVKSFGEVVRTMRSDDVTYNLAVILDTRGKEIHPVAYMNIAAFLQKAEKERSGVVSTMNSSLELWANPLIDTATATSDFSFMDLKKRKTTVYVGLTPDNLTRLRPLMQVFYQQATEFLCRKLPGPDEPYGVLFMMDEFPTLGKMEQFQTGIAYFRGYRVRLFLIIQDTEQLKGIYEDSGMNSFLSNATYRITFAANNIETANLISQLIGNKTVQQESLNRPKYFDLNPSSRSLHVSDTQRALLLPQEVITLPRDEQILLIESTSPIRSKKIKYFDDTLFTKRLLKKTFVPTQDPYDPSKSQHGKKETVDTTDAPVEEEAPKQIGSGPQDDANYAGGFEQDASNHDDEYEDTEEEYAEEDDGATDEQEESEEEYEDDAMDEQEEVEEEYEEDVEEEAEEEYEEEYEEDDATNEQEEGEEEYEEDVEEDVEEDDGATDEQEEVEEDYEEDVEEDDAEEEYVEEETEESNKDIGKPLYTDNDVINNTETQETKPIDDIANNKETQ